MCGCVCVVFSSHYSERAKSYTQEWAPFIHLLCEIDVLWPASFHVAHRRVFGYQSLGVRLVLWSTHYHSMTARNAANVGVRHFSKTAVTSQRSTHSIITGRAA